MNANGLAYSTLIELIEGWAEGQPELVPHPDHLARMGADYIFTDLLGVSDSEIDNEG